MVTSNVGFRFLFVIIFAFLANHVVTSAKWRQARDVFLSNVPTLSEMVKRQPSHMIATRDLFGLTKDEDVTLMDSAPSEQGTTIKKYGETYGGLPVFDATLTVETDAKTDVYTGQVTGNLVQNLDDDINSTIPNFTEQEVMQLAANYGNFPMEGARIDYEKLQLMIYVKDDVGILVYQVQYYAESGAKNYRFCMMIDAKNGTLAEKWNTLNTARSKYDLIGIGGNKLIGKTIYGDDSPYLEVTREGEDCYFENGIVTVVNMKGKRFLDNEGPNGFRVKCAIGTKDKTNGAYSPVNDAFFNGNVVYKMYTEWAKLPPKKQMPMVFRVHYSRNEVNAFYNGRNFTFGDGDRNHRPLVSLDIIAHEVSHSFTHEHSMLMYRDQSGGLNEAFSDLAGEAAESFLNEHNDWKIGGDIAKKPIRNVCNQSLDGYSIIHASDYKQELDVHFLSGVFNRFFCLLAGRKGWNIKKVFRVAVQCNRLYWHPTTKFNEAACDFMKSTYDFGYNTVAVSKVLKKIGIKVCDLSSYIRPVEENSKIAGLSVIPGEEILFKLKITNSTSKDVRISTFGGLGEADLFICYRKVRCREHKTKWRSNEPGTVQQVLIKSPKKGKYFIRLRPKTSSIIISVTLKVIFEYN